MQLCAFFLHQPANRARLTRRSWCADVKKPAGWGGMEVKVIYTWIASHWPVSWINARARAELETATDHIFYPNGKDDFDLNGPALSYNAEATSMPEKPHEQP